MYKKHTVLKKDDNLLIIDKCQLKKGDVVTMFSSLNSIYIVLDTDDKYIRCVNVKSNTTCKLLSDVFYKVIASEKPISFTVNCQYCKGYKSLNELHHLLLDEELEICTKCDGDGKQRFTLNLPTISSDDASKVKTKKTVDVEYETKEVTFVDPPSGYRYGFPKRLPEKLDKGKIIDFFVECGYPQSLIDKFKGQFVYSSFNKELLKLKVNDKNQISVKKSKPIVKEIEEFVVVCYFPKNESNFTTKIDGLVETYIQTVKDVSELMLFLRKEDIVIGNDDIEMLVKDGDLELENGNYYIQKVKRKI